MEAGGARLNSGEAALIMDIGTGTLDILVAETGRPPEASYKMVLPSPTMLKAEAIRKITAQRKALFFNGKLMGGGPVTMALKEHLKAGLPAYATREAALTFNDNLEKIQSWGVQFTEEPPRDAATVELADVDLKTLREISALVARELPRRFVVAAQDHGFSPHTGNREFRMSWWRSFIASGGELAKLAYTEPPSFFTRLKAIKETLGETLLMDTGAAAICGALMDPRVAERREQGVLAVNVGNGHVLGAYIRGERLWGIFEHHSGKIGTPELKTLVDRLSAGTLTHEEVYTAGGHGAALAPDLKELGPPALVAVTGPKRRMARPLPYYMAAPGGDMMLVGCFGLLDCARRLGFLPPIHA